MKRTLQLSYENINEKAKKPFATPFWCKFASNLQMKAIRLLWQCQFGMKPVGLVKQNMSHVCGRYTTLSDVIQIAAKKNGLGSAPSLSFNNNNMNIMNKNDVVLILTYLCLNFLLKPSKPKFFFELWPSATAQQTSFVREQCHMKKYHSQVSILKVS